MPAPFIIFTNNDVWLETEANKALLEVGEDSDWLDGYRNMLRSCLKALTKKQHQVMNLYLQGASVSKIAKKLNKSTGNVSDIIKNAKERIKKELYRRMSNLNEKP